MSPAGTVGGDERLRLFLGFRLPDPAAHEIAAWERDELDVERARIVPAENLHVTIAFLGSRPASETVPIADALRESVRGVSEPVLTPVRYRETRSVGMLVLDDEGDRATRIAVEAQRRLAELGVYEPEQRPWLPHLTVVRFRQQPRLSPELPGLGAVVPSGAAVYLSKLRPTGAEYVVVQTFGVGGGET
jgi:2'-5' RNA ligase